MNCFKLFFCFMLLVKLVSISTYLLGQLFFNYTNSKLYFRVLKYAVREMNLKSIVMIF